MNSLDNMQQFIRQQDDQNRAHYINEIKKNINEDISNGLILSRISYQTRCILNFYQIKKDKSEALSGSQMQAQKLHSALEITTKVVLIIYTVMNIIQRPSWCNYEKYDVSQKQDTNQNQDRCQPKNGSYMIPTFTFYYLSIYIYYPIEIIILLYLMFIKCLDSYFQNDSKKLLIWQFSIALIIILGGIIVMITNNQYNLQIGNFFKPIFLILYSHIMRQTSRFFIKVFFKAKGIFILMFFNLSMFAGIGKVIFKGENEKLFHNYWDGIYNLYCLQTTVTYPDVMLPYYNTNQFYAIFFITFLTINTLLIVNMVIGVFYKYFKDEIEKVTYKILYGNEKHIDQLTQEYFLKFNQPNIRTASNADLIAIIQEKRQFLILINKQNNKIFRILDNNYFEFFMECLSLSCYSLIYFNFYYHALWITINLCFNCIFFIEEILLIIFLGPLMFFSKFTNILSISVSLSLITLLVLNLQYNLHYLEQWILIFMLYRILRSLKLVMRQSEFQKMAMAFINLLPQAYVFFAVLFMLFSFYIALGQHLFGGMMNTSIIDKLESNSISQLYIYNNFNDFVQGLILCFSLLIVNNWNIISKSFQIVAETELCALFFVIFHITTVLLALNITIAFMIDYMVKRSKQSKVEQCSQDKV